MENKITFKSLNKKQKLEHIWEYYRFHILGTLIGVILLTSLVQTIVTGKRNQYDVNVVVSGKLSYDEKIVDQTKEEWLQKFNADLELLAMDWDVNNMSRAVNEQVLMLRMQARECDILALSPMRHEGFLTQLDYDLFLPLDTEPKLQQLLKNNEDKLIKSKSKEDGRTYVYGIEVDGVGNIPGVQVGESFIFSIISVPKNKDAAVELLMYLLQ